MSRARYAVVAIVVLVVLGGARWLLTPEAGDATSAPPAPPPASADATPQALLGAQGPQLQAAPRAPTRPSIEQGGSAAGPDGVARPLLEVLVVDAEGQPMAGVPVALLARVAGNRIPVVAVSTDAAGRARPDAMAEVVRRVRAKHVDAHFVVEAQVALPVLPEHDLGTEPTTSGPVVLRVPRAPRLEVEVVDEHGARIDEPSEVYLFWRRAGAGAARWDRVGLPSARTQGGRACFAVVPSGFELLVRSMGTERRHWAQTVVPPQPVDAGTVQARVVLDTLKELLRLRVLDDQGQALASTELTVAYWLPAGDPEAQARPLRTPQNAHWQSTDERGVLTLAVPMQPQPGRRRVLFVERPPTNPRTDERVPRLLGLLPLEGRLRPGIEMDLGVLTLEAEVFLDAVQGRVVDASGAPLESALVHAQFRHVQDGSAHLDDLGEQVRTASDGSFVVRSPHTPPGEILLHAYKAGYQNGYLEVRHGARDLELKLERR